MNIQSRLGRLLGSADSDTPLALVMGAAFCLFYAVLHLAINGIIIDEAAAAAQVIGGGVSYPPGHPHGVFYTEAYSLFNYLAGALWQITPNVTLISALRNILYVFLMTFVPFSLTLVLTRSAVMAHLAVALGMMDPVQLFAGIYWVPVFPVATGISHGPIGMGFGLLTVAVILAKCRRTGAFLLGILPSIHATVAMAVWLWAGIYLIFIDRGWRQEKRRATLWSFAAGLSVCVILAAVIFLRTPEQIPVSSPFHTNGDWQAVRQNFMEMTDSHRRPLAMFSLGYFTAPVVLLCLSGLLVFREGWNIRAILRNEDRANALSVALFGLICWSLVYGAWLWLGTFGRLPDIIEIIMPWRYSGLAAVLLIPLTLAAFATIVSSLRKDAHIWALFAAAIVLLLASISHQRVLQFTALQNPQFLSDNLLALIWGVLAGICFRLTILRRQRFLIMLLPWTLICLSLLPFVSSSGMAWTFLAGMAASVILSKLLVLSIEAGPLRNIVIKTGNVLPIAVLACLFMLPRHIHRTDYHRLKVWLEKNGKPNEMVLPFIYPVFALQPKLSHPVLIKSETLMQMSYMPKLAPAVGTIVRDIFGIDYGNRQQLAEIGENGHLKLDSAVWREAWTQRSRSDWHKLAMRYGFRLVLVPKGVILDLDVALRDRSFTLYLIRDVLADI